MDTWYIRRFISGLMGLALHMDLRCFFKWSLAQFPQDLQHMEPPSCMNEHNQHIRFVSHDPHVSEEVFKKLLNTQTIPFPLSFLSKMLRWSVRLLKLGCHLWTSAMSGISHPERQMFQKVLAIQIQEIVMKTILLLYTWQLPPRSFITDIFIVHGNAYINLDNSQSDQHINLQQILASAFSKG